MANKNKHKVPMNLVRKMVCGRPIRSETFCAQTENTPVTTGATPNTDWNSNPKRECEIAIRK